MNSQKLLFFLFTFIFFSVQGWVRGRQLGRQFQPTKLYVFGDSYVDTGNIGISNFSCWDSPYGITFPGKPSGRFSDGRVLTDYIANYFGVKDPVPFRIYKEIASRENGINFAFGGTGVFDTQFPFPNMTNQIDLFDDFVMNTNNDSLFITKDIDSSLALISASGNDYSFHLTQHAFDLEDFEAFVVSVVDQIIVNVKRINGLGVKKVVLTGLGPLGCLPQLTAPSTFSQCNDTINSLVTFHHNLLLKQAVDKLNNESKDSSTFLILDIYDAFMPIIIDHTKSTFESPLKPCCFGISSGFLCGDVDEKGDKMFTLCQDPKSAFFWDFVHPTQQGWLAAFKALESDLIQL